MGLGTHPRDISQVIGATRAIGIEVFNPPLRVAAHEEHGAVAFLADLLKELLPEQLVDLMVHGLRDVLLSRVRAWVIAHMVEGFSSRWQGHANPKQPKHEMLM